MANTEKPVHHVAAEHIGAAIEFWSAPVVNAYFAMAKSGFDMFRAFIPDTAPSSFGKEED